MNMKKTLLFFILIFSSKTKVQSMFRRGFFRIPPHVMLNFEHTYAMPDSGQDFYITTLNHEDKDALARMQLLIPLVCNIQGNNMYIDPRLNGEERKFLVRMALKMMHKK